MTHSSKGGYDLLSWHSSLKHHAKHIEETTDSSGNAQPFYFFPSAVLLSYGCAELKASDAFPLK